MCACPATYYLFYVRNGDILVFSDHRINLGSINLLSVLPVFISEPVWSLYIFISGIIMFVYQILYIHFIVRCRLFRVFSHKSFI